MATNGNRKHFFAIFDPRSPLVRGVFECSLSGVMNSLRKRELVALHLLCSYCRVTILALCLFPQVPVSHVEAHVHDCITWILCDSPHTWLYCYDSFFNWFYLFVCFYFTTKSTFFQSSRDGSSLLEPVLSSGYSVLHNTVTPPEVMLKLATILSLV